MDGHDKATAFIEVDADGRYLDASPEALAIYGLSLEALRGHRIGDFGRPGLGAVHAALFRWLVRRGHDFGGGDSTIVSAQGREVRIRCTSVAPCGDRYRITFRVLPGDGVPPHSPNIPAVLDAWREAEREVEAADSDDERDLAGRASESLRDIYHYVSEQKLEQESDPVDSRA